MSLRIPRISLVSMVLLLPGLPLTAVPIDITGASSTVLPAQSHLTVEFGVWNYGFNNPDSSPYPTRIGFLLPGKIPASANVETAPGSTMSYYPEYRFEAWLSSLDGSVVIPWAGAHDLYAIPGVICRGGCTDAMIIQGAFELTPAQSEALFGDNLDNFSNAALFHLVNHGLPFTLGSEAFPSIGQAIQFPGIAGAGIAQTGGLTGIATINNPEPATFLLASGALALFWGRKHLRRRKAAKANPAR
jgi:hypothetical protein